MWIVSLWPLVLVSPQFLTFDSAELKEPWPHRKFKQLFSERSYIAEPVNRQARRCFVKISVLF